VIGLYAVQRPRIGRLGLFGAAAFAYSYVFFTSTVVYALATETRNWDALGKVFGAWMTVHGLIMLVGGLAFGLAVVRAGVLQRWTGVCLMAGVVLIVAMSGQSNLARTAAEAVTATAFMGMGVGLLSGRSTSSARADLATAAAPSCIFRPPRPGLATKSSERNKPRCTALTSAGRVPTQARSPLPVAARQPLAVASSLAPSDCRGSPAARDGTYGSVEPGGSGGHWLQNSPRSDYES